MKPKLTVFTPTYNRKNTLILGYEALLRQTCKDFIWLIIDDGSSDGTKAQVEEWQQRRNGFEIQYVFKENGGLHTGYNKAIEIMDTELCVCIDSDDYMPDDAVESILAYWDRYGSEAVAGIIGRDYKFNGEPIGGSFPSCKTLHVIELIDKYGYRGDTKMVFRTDLLKQVAPQPTFGNEKNFNPIYMILQVDRLKPFLLYDKNLCFVEYSETGMSRNIFRQYHNSPNSFAALRKLNMSLPNTTFRFRFRQHIHYVSSSIFARNHKFIRQSPAPLMTLCAIPFGFLLTCYIKSKL